MKAKLNLLKHEDVAREKNIRFYLVDNWIDINISEEEKQLDIF